MRLAKNDTNASAKTLTSDLETWFTVNLKQDCVKGRESMPLTIDPDNYSSKKKPGHHKNANYYAPAVQSY